MKKRLLSFFFACLMVVFSVPVSAEDAQTKTLLALGDSISAGYGLASPEKEAFVYGISGYGENVVNMAVVGYKASDVWEQLQNKDADNYVSDTLIKNASVVTLTCGGNDLMAILYQKVMEVWNENNPSDTITFEEVVSRLSSGDMNFLKSAMKIFDSNDKDYLVSDPDFNLALDKYTETLTKITSYINLINPMCAVVVATQYNPYEEFRNSLFSVVYKGIEEGVKKLNDAIIQNSVDGGYMVAFVKEKFDVYTGGGDLYNANANIASLNLDFHPTAEGHSVICKAFEEAISEIEYVNYTVSHFYENLGGGFDEEKQNHKAVLGVNITAVQEAKFGFSYVAGYNGEVKTATAKEKTELKLYYNRNTYSISWKIDDKTEENTLKYGEKIVEAKAKRSGYKLSGWDKEVPETMPAENLSFVAQWKKDSNIVVYVIAGLVIAGVLFVLLKKVLNSKKVENQNKN
jgi:lysophospholipase L1-like esterase